MIPPYAPTLYGRDVAGWLDLALAARDRGDMVEARRCNDVAVGLARDEVSARVSLFGRAAIVDSDSSAKGGGEMLVVTVRHNRSSDRPAAKEYLVVENEDEFTQKMFGQVGWRRERSVTVVTTDIDVDVEFDEGGAL